MVDAYQIDSTAVYDDGALALALGLSAAALAKGRRDGTLGYTRKGQRTLYLGQWVLDWLAADVPQGVAHAD